MKYLYQLLAFLLLSTSILFAQDTFSIVAVDTETGEVGSAGASCLDDIQFPGSGGVSIICRVYPGRGAINTQALWNAANQENAGQQLLEGKSPQEVITWLTANDVENNRHQRQYGIIDFDENGVPRTAGFTGQFTTAYKGHILGENYAIQGNILLGKQILDSMEVRFNRAEGSLAEKLMAALQGANVPGADKRCLEEGVSSLSAYIKVAKPTDSESNVYLDIVVPFTDFGVEPIDVLQEAFNEWLNPTDAPELQLPEPTIVRIHPNPINSQTVFEIENPNSIAPYVVQIFDASGKQLQKFYYNPLDTQLTVKQLGGKSGVYLYHVWQQDKLVAKAEFLIAD
ncbi:MAG: DUF1028 domain-containing protein [Chitinophagales bacterium]